MRNKLLVIALLLILPVFVTACTLKDLPVIGKFFSGNGANPLAGGKSGTISIWGLWEDPQVMEALINKYKETNPNVTVVYDDRSILKADQYKETVYTRMMQDSQSPADIILVHNSWLDSAAQYLSSAPKDFMDPGAYSTSYYPSAVEAGLRDGKIYAVPAYYDGLALVYNKKHFEEVDQQTPPTAWEEFRRLALTLTKRDGEGKLIRAGAAIGAADNIDFFGDILGMMLAQAGVSVPKDLQTQSAADALSFYTTFVNSDGVWDSSLPEASVAFVQEKVSMIFVPSWNLLDIIKMRPDLSIGAAPVPQARASNPVSWGSFWMYAVPAKSTNKDLAWDFIKFLSSDEAQLLMFNTASQFRTYGAPFAGVGLKDQISSGAASAYLKPYLDTAGFSKGGVFSGRAGNVTAVTALKNAVDSVISPDPRTRASTTDALKAVKVKLSGGQ